MGLDNGLIAKKTNIEKINKKLLALGSYDYGETVEIAYWRKCWNVRYAIGDALGTFYDNGNTYVNKEEVLAIIEELKRFNKHNWLNNGWDGSIWDWNEIKKSHRANIRRLHRLVRLMDKYPMIEVYFYDSY